MGYRGMRWLRLCCAGISDFKMGMQVHGYLVVVGLENDCASGLQVSWARSGIYLFSELHSNGERGHNKCSAIAGLAPPLLSLQWLLQTMLRAL
ncbi:hypothetical protein GIB67_007887 [Kingdonia uniflora]|uniref:Uncharacterized protein n=1 Tax=Kingdonia uniflora TaxID=39325 RepID=A0A7J7PBJ3_9MAGN|nr:hypothetical protein GIB67_007887 [Kingdonia uniflora]